MNIIKPILILAFAALFVSCDDFLEKNISGAKVGVIAPVDNATVAAGIVTFSWREIDGATSYRITIVTPNFESAAQVVSDTIVLRDSLPRPFNIKTELAAGNYQWSIQGINSAYQTHESVQSLFVKQEETEEEVEP